MTAASPESPSCQTGGLAPARAEIAGNTAKLHTGRAPTGQGIEAVPSVSSSARSTSEMIAALAGALRVNLVDVRKRHSATEPGTRRSASERKGESRNEF